MLENIRDTVRAQPWRAVGMAALAGACTALAGSRSPLLRAVADHTLANLLSAARRAVTAELAHASSNTSS
jgi:hypothetical protein